MKLKVLLLGAAVSWPWPAFAEEPDVNTLYAAGPGVIDQYICYDDGSPPIDPDRLSSLVLDHELYVDSDGKEGKYAELCNANLRKADLYWADLSRTTLIDADLRRAILVGAKLNGANLELADLSGANLESADLTGADLTGAILTGANLNGAILTNARMSHANLSGVTYVPKKQPNVEDIAQAKCLHLLKRDDELNDPGGLFALRNSLQVAGYREQERQVTYALKHSDFFTQRPVDGQETRDDGLESRDDSECVEFATVKRTDKGLIETRISYLLFELPTAWGMHPSRALVVLFTLIPFFAIPYAFALRSARRDGIWRVWSNERAREDQGSDKPELMVTGLPGAIRLGLYFSLISAFHLGWRDFNVGNWISRLQTREYSLQASGWVRTVAGIQSLISVYLLAMWALTFFGRPFG